MHIYTLNSLHVWMSSLYNERNLHCNTQHCNSCRELSTVNLIQKCKVFTQLFSLLVIIKTISLDQSVVTNKTYLCLGWFVKLVSWYEQLFSRGRTGTLMLLSAASWEARALVNSVRWTCWLEPWLCRVWSTNVLMQMMCSVTQRPGKNTSTADPFRSDSESRAGPVQPWRWATISDFESSVKRQVFHKEKKNHQV